MNKSTISNKSQTDWERLDAMNDENIDLSDIPELTPEMFAQAVIKHGLKDKENKAQLTIRVDQDVLTWFKLQGRGYQTRINSLLRAYMEANTSHKKPPGQQAQR
ncbi:MAG: BrnA antitoxin family protein [Anaerolineae bacterium]|nr:BrnA antitoxin family protein [Anaerolineae bacterium]